MSAVDASRYAKNGVVHVGDVLGKDQSMYTVYDADEILNRISFAGLYPANTRVAEFSESLCEKIRWYYGNEITDLTTGQIAIGLATIAKEFDVEGDLVRITRDELWARSTTGKGTPGRVVEIINKK